MLASVPLMWNLKNWKLKTDELEGLRQQSPGKEGKRMEEWRDWESMTNAAQSDFRDLDKTQKQCKPAVMLHIADMMATHFDEAEV